MDEDKLSEEDAALLRSRLHIRAARKLLEHEKNIHGIGTFYDALEYAMRWFYLTNFTNLNKEILYDPCLLFDFFKENNIFSNNFNFLKFQEIVYMYLESNNEFLLNSSELHDLIVSIEDVLSDLKIVPFNHDILPEENEETKNLLNLDNYDKVK